MTTQFPWISSSDRFQGYLKWLISVNVWWSLDPSNSDLRDFPFRIWYRTHNGIGHRWHCYHLYLVVLLETSIQALGNMLCHSLYRVFFIEVLRTEVSTGSAKAPGDPFPLKLKSIESREIFVVNMQLDVPLWYWFVAISTWTSKICDAILNLRWKITGKTFLIRALRTTFINFKRICPWGPEPDRKHVRNCSFYGIEIPLCRRSIFHIQNHLAENYLKSMLDKSLVFLL